VALTNKNKRISLNKFAMATKTNAFNGSNNIPALTMKTVQGIKVKILNEAIIKNNNVLYLGYASKNPVIFATPLIYN
jgi:hypothetical protein